MAIADFDKFCMYAGVNQVQLKACIERKKGLTFGQISQKLKVPKSTVRNICERCLV
ncbi:MarR family transcriptional regulator [Chryseobacterium lactis]|uniref:MarR family transcriptional regulator n=2 Tax=Chryseobacterium lactis TaxID=1241981 RepID=A0ABN5RKA5_CHRLC|nr:MarR family transcriptional regulator [Chryseobacterium lactis]AZB02547.1 MarR family transcriptional regulator [Chryseobacterium lactis]